MKDGFKCEIISSNSTSGPGDAGKTGSWRVERPVIHYDRCTPARRQKPACYICWMYCPDGVISKELEPKIDLTYCKGCGICAQECPVGAIEMVEESSLIDEKKESHEND